MNILNTIFEHHDNLSRDAVFADTAKERQQAFTKAEGIRELIWAIKDTVKPKEQDRFTEAIEAHFAAIGKGIFYKRNLDFER
jgi:hypothetical protein